VATWIDDYGGPNDRGEIAGVTDFEGTRADVLAWARAQPAAYRLMPGEAGWIALPDDDKDVLIRGDTGTSD
jgi:hypothetical protein